MASCHVVRTNDEATAPTATRPNAPVTTRRNPNRAMSDAANGPIRPNTRRLTDAGNDAADRLHPNSSISGPMSSEYIPRVLEETSNKKSVVAATIQA